MAKSKSQAQHRIQSPNGRYAQMPKQTLDCALQCLSPRAFKVLWALNSRFNGYNNGEIHLAMRALGDVTGSKCNSANAKAIAELEQNGFIWIAKRYPKGQRKASAYGLTFISSGANGVICASHDYLHLAKSQGWKCGTEERKTVAESGTDRKYGVPETDTEATETPPVSTPPPEWKSDTHISNHGIGVVSNSDDEEVDRGNHRHKPRGSVSPHDDSRMELNDLRTALRGYLARPDALPQTALAAAIHCPGGTLSKFRNGRGLPECYRMALQLELGKHDGLRHANAA